MPEKIRRCEEQLGRLQRQLGSLRSLQPTWVLYKDAREALPGLTAREAELREREQNAADQVGVGQTASWHEDVYVSVCPWSWEVFLRSARQAICS